MNFDNLPVSKDQLIEMLERRGIIAFLSQTLQVECTRLLDLDLHDGCLELFVESENGSEIIVRVLFDTQSVLDLISAFQEPEEEEDESWEAEATLLDVEPE